MGGARRTTTASTSRVSKSLSWSRNERTAHSQTSSSDRHKRFHTQNRIVQRIAIIIVLQQKEMMRCSIVVLDSLTKYKYLNNMRPIPEELPLFIWTVSEYFHSCGITGQHKIQ